MGLRSEASYAVKTRCLRPATKKPVTKSIRVIRAIFSKIRGPQSQPKQLVTKTIRVIRAILYKIRGPQSQPKQPVTKSIRVIRAIFSKIRGPQSYLKKGSNFPLNSPGISQRFIVWASTKKRVTSPVFNSSSFSL